MDHDWRPEEYLLGKGPDRGVLVIQATPRKTECQDSISSLQANAKKKDPVDLSLPTLRNMMSCVRLGDLQCV